MKSRIEDHRLDASHGKGQVSVLVAACNEEKTIGHVLLQLLDLSDIDIKEVIVVDDGSHDRTAEIVNQIAAGDSRVRLIHQQRTLGKTSAIARAVAEASGDIVVVQDADLEYDPAELPAVVAPILAGHADVVYGSRFMVRRAARVMYFYHYLGNRLLTFLSDLLTNRNMTDIETGYKAFRAGLIKPLRLTSRGFGMEAEITAMVCKTHARTYEVPISYYGRTYEEGKKIGFWDGIMALYYILYYNLIAPLLPSGRAFIREANRFLETVAACQSKEELHQDIIQRPAKTGRCKGVFSAILLALLTILPLGCSRGRDAAERIKALGGKVETDPDNGAVVKVFLGQTDADDGDMQTVARFPHLRELYLRGTQVTDEGLRHLAGLSKLELLELNGTTVGDVGLEHLKELHSLTRLRMRNTKITDAGLDSLTMMPELQELDLQGTAIDDHAVKTLSEIKSLKTLAVAYSRVSRDGAAAIRRALPNVSIDWPPRAAKAVAVQGVIRIKAGSGSPFTDSSGHVWQPDFGFDGGGWGRFPDAPVADTNDPGLYRSQHFGMNSFAINVPNGKYVAKLHFAETKPRIHGPGQRVFSFNVQGREFKDFDIWQRAGGANCAYVETVRVQVSDGKFRITFTKQIDNPVIHAIELALQEASALPAALPVPVAVQGAIRIRAGSMLPYTDSNGHVWQAELGFQGGRTLQNDSKASIANTKDPELYRSQHFGMDAFSCQVPNGKYLAKLHFAETYEGIRGEGWRVFSFNVQGHEFKDFDIWQKAGGPNRAYVEAVPVEVIDGVFAITFTTQDQYPKINAIELIPEANSASTGAEGPVRWPL